ncbi:MAG: type II toxin-antitoxin system PemK/MazF family toxin [Rickettsiales bacterium]|nr:type II toxin-antitoxin system PemK/MazF family toxin [Rickettsiales bacterium]
MEKDFYEWSNLKTKLNVRKNIPTFKQGEIWWCSIGVNIGCEEDGKNEMFNRPVLIIRKFNNNMFLGVPLSTKIKDNKYYFQIYFSKRVSSVLLSQIRVFESKRLTHKVATLAGEQLENVREKIREMI